MSLRPGRGSPEYERIDATDLAERAAGRRLSPGEVSSYWTDRALDFITGRPGDWLALMGRKVLLLVNADEMLDTESQESYAEWSWPLRATGWLAHFGLLVPMAVIGVWATWPDRWRLAILYALTIAYAASVLLFYVFARYRFPLVPMLMLPASAGALTTFIGVMPAFRRLFSSAAGAPPPAGTNADASPRISSSSARHGRRRVPAPALLLSLAAVSVLCNWPLLSQSRMQAITETNLATALYEQKRLDEAIVHYRRALEIEPRHAPAFSNMGVALRAAGRLDEAEAAYRQALAIQPDNPDTHYNLANALLDQNRPAEAAEHFRLAGREAPASGNVQNNLGIALAAEGRMAEAAAAFRQALAIEPDSARAHRNLGDALASLGQTDDALRHLRRAVEIAPADVGFRYDLAVALLEAGRLPEAVVEFRAALTIDPQFAPAHNNLGVALGSQGQLDEAIRHFERALEIQPGYADAARNLEMARKARRTR
jgi:tetratricopeptide (TPR) repeat protein